MLVVIEIGAPVPRSNGSRSTSRMRSAIWSAPPSTSTTNSSPPRRPIVSLSRRTSPIRPATRRSSSSPTGWPKVSLTPLKPSRSMNIAEASTPRRRAWTSICSARSMISARFGSPVSASCSAWWRSWPVFSSTIRSARARPRASTWTSPKASRPMTSQISSTSVAWTPGEESPVGAAAVTETVQRPSASTAIRRLSTDPLGTVPKRATDELASVSESVRNAGPAPVGTRFSGTAACSRSSETAMPVWPRDGGAQDRLGVEEADDPAGRGGAATRRGSRARRRRGRPARRPRTSRARGWT